MQRAIAPPRASLVPPRARAYTCVMDDSDEIRAWASRYLDLWERHLIAESDDPARAAGGRTLPSGEPAERPPGQDKPVGEPE